MVGLGLPIQNIWPGGYHNQTGKHFLAKTNPSNSSMDEKSADVLARKCSPV